MERRAGAPLSEQDHPHNTLTEVRRFAGADVSSIASYQDFIRLTAGFRGNIAELIAAKGSHAELRHERNTQHTPALVKDSFEGVLFDGSRFTMETDGETLHLEKRMPSDARDREGKYQRDEKPTLIVEVPIARDFPIPPDDLRLTPPVRAITYDEDGTVHHFAPLGEASPADLQETAKIMKKSAMLALVALQNPIVNPSLPDQY